MSQYDGFLPRWEHSNYPISIFSCWVFARMAFNLSFVWPTTALMATRTLFGTFWEWLVCRSSHCSNAVYWFASFETRSLQGSRYSCTTDWLFILTFRGACLFERHDHSSCLVVKLLDLKIWRSKQKLRLRRWKLPVLEGRTWIEELRGILLQNCISQLSSNLNLEMLRRNHLLSQFSSHTQHNALLGPIK